MITGKKIENMLQEAWKNFKEYFDRNASRYSREYFDKHLQRLDEREVRREVKKLHWICWNEADLKVQLSRYFYSQRKIESVSNKEFLNIEMHFDKNLNYYNFEGYSFENILWPPHDDLKKELNKSRNFPRGYPELDLIITCENSYGPFLLCAEAKCFHASFRGSVDEAIEKDIITLSAIKKLGITKKIAYIIFDDYYYINNRKDLRKLTCDYSKKHNINNELKILYHETKSKLIDV